MNWWNRLRSKEPFSQLDRNDKLTEKERERKREKERERKREKERVPGRPTAPPDAVTRRPTAPPGAATPADKSAEQQYWERNRRSYIDRPIPSDNQRADKEKAVQVAYQKLFQKDDKSQQHWGGGKKRKSKKRKPKTRKSKKRRRSKRKTQKRRRSNRKY